MDARAIPRLSSLFGDITSDSKSSTALPNSFTLAWLDSIQFRISSASEERGVSVGKGDTCTCVDDVEELELHETVAVIRNRATKIDLIRFMAQM